MVACSLRRGWDARLEVRIPDRIRETEDFPCDGTMPGVRRVADGDRRTPIERDVRGANRPAVVDRRAEAGARSELDGLRWLIDGVRRVDGLVATERLIRDTLLRAPGCRLPTRVRLAKLRDPTERLGDLRDAPIERRPIEDRLALRADVRPMLLAFPPDRP